MQLEKLGGNGIFGEMSVFESYGRLCSYETLEFALSKRETNKTRDVRIPLTKTCLKRDSCFVYLSR